MSPNLSVPAEPFHLVEVLLRHRWKILLTPLVVFALGALVILFFPRSYASEAKLLMRVGRESVGIDPTATTGQMLMLQQSGRDSEVKSAIDLLISRGLAEKLVDNIGPEYVLAGGPAEEGASNPITAAIKAPLAGLASLVRSIDEVSDRELAILKLQKGLDVKAERDSTVISATYEADSPIGAQHILQTMLGIYEEEYLRSHLNPQSRGFFEEQASRLKEQLATAEQKYRDAKNRMGLASVDGRRATYESQLNLIEQSLYNTEQQHATTSALVEDLRQQLNQLPERLIASRKSLPNEGADLLRDQLYQLQVKQIDLKARYHDDHPLVLAVSAQVEEAKEIVDQQKKEREETVDDINPIHRDLSLQLKQHLAELAGIKARLRTLDEQKRLVLSDQKQLNGFEVELEQLQREVYLARDKYMKYANSLEQARMDAALEEDQVSSFSMAQEPTLQEKPVSPSKTLVAAGSLLLAIGATISSVIFAEAFRGKIYTATQAEQSLGVPVYAEVPESSTHGRVLSQ